MTAKSPDIGTSGKARGELPIAWLDVTAMRDTLAQQELIPIYLPNKRLNRRLSFMPSARAGYRTRATGSTDNALTNQKQGHVPNRYIF